MKIIILHGDDVEKSYKRLTLFIKEAKRRNWDIVNDKIEDTPSLFNIEKLIVIRDIKLLNEKNLKIIKKIPGTLVIYLTKKIPASVLKILPSDVKKELFEMPFLLWKFLDDMNLKNFRDVIKTLPVEFVFAMIARRLKDLYLVQNGNPKMNSWQTGKLKNQIQKLKTKNLKLLISELADIDVKSKTGGPNLKDSLDLFIVKRLA